MDLNIVVYDVFTDEIHVTNIYKIMVNSILLVANQDVNKDKVDVD